MALTPVIKKCFERLVLQHIKDCPKKHSTDQGPLHMNGECVERVHTFRFLCNLIPANISWTENTSRQSLPFLRVLWNHGLDSNLLPTFYRSSIESLLTDCMTVWYINSTATDRDRVQRVVKAAQKIIGGLLPSLVDIYASAEDCSHPGFELFDLLSSRRC